MKTSEIKMLWRLVKAGEKKPLSAADFALLVRIRFALQTHEAVVAEDRISRGGNPPEKLK